MTLHDAARSKFLARQWSIGRVLVTISDVLWRNVAASVNARGATRYRANNNCRRIDDWRRRQDALGDRAC